MSMEDRAGAKEADAGNDLRGDARRVTIGTSIGRETDLRDVNREMREERGADADENVRTKAGRLPGDLALEADRAAEERGEEELEEQLEAEGVGEVEVRRPMRDCLLEQNCESGNCQRSARIEIADVSRGRVRRRVTVRDAARLVLELRDRRFVRLGWRGEVAKDRSTAPFADDTCGHGLFVEPLIPTRQADEGEETAGAALVSHGARG
jgi:hypothetical protein